MRDQGVKTKPAAAPIAPAFDEAEALRYPLFQDDFGAPGDRVLRDKIATRRKQAQCNECLDPILPGNRYRSHVGVYDGSLMSYAFCAGCCAAMAKVFNGDEEAMEARWAQRAINEGAQA